MNQSAAPFELVRQRLRQDYFITDVCVICLSNDPSFVFLPCLHACVCYDCSSELYVMEQYSVTQAGDIAYRVCSIFPISSCPMCRKKSM
jgi:hypothetical protein